MTTLGNSSSWRGATAAAVHSDLETEQAALAAGCGVFARPLDALAMTGADRARFLAGQVTCDVASLSTGAGAFGFLASQKGRIDADLVVLATDDALWLELPPNHADAVRARLEKYIIVDRVELAPLDQRVLSLPGPRAGELLGDLVGELPEAVRGHRSVEIDGVAARVVRDADLVDPSYSLWAAADEVATLIAALVGAGALQVGHRAWDTPRVEAGRPLWGVDFGVKNFPQETGLDDEAVSYTKGCYLGQEVIARIHYRGGVQRRLRGLRFDGEAAAGDALQVGGKTVGRLGTVVDSPRLGRVGLAIVQDKAEPGSTVAVAADDAERGSATVVELPFGE
ncbi:MAG: glycine cleavage T C-terminal barrel domain-containing protein [Acidobacteriota bacterium]